MRKRNEMKYLWIGILLSLLPLLLPSRAAAQDAVAWVTWEDALARSREDDRKVLLHIYTDWCTLCRKMEEQTFSDPEVVRYINANFHPVRINAEGRQELSYRDKTYNYVRDGKVGYHALAAELLRGQLSFPSLVFLDSKQDVIQSITGFRDARQMKMVATYFAEDYYRNTPWSAFEKKYQDKNR